MRQPLFTRGDWILSAICTVVSFAIYAWGAAPNVTLLDSGEFVVAAEHLGVPHPTGYPIWTMLAWAFQLLPLGNAAWEIALFSAVCGALATGICALLAVSSIRWLLGDRLEQNRLLAPLATIGFALAFAFSESVWSQAEIAEVYTLHALLTGLFLLCLFWWLRQPQSSAAIYSAFFTLALSFGNHHLTVVLAPLPFLVALLIRRDIFWDLVASAGVCLLLAYLGFAYLSNDMLVVKAAVRLAYLVGAGLLLLLVVRRFRVQWGFIGLLPMVIMLGLLPYAYMPFASSTNPPMNWGYARMPAGFFFSINRSQYRGSLSDQTLRTLGRVLGVSSSVVPERSAGDGAKPAPASDEPAALARPTPLQLASGWTRFFSTRLARSFTPLAAFFFLAAFAVVLRVELAKRVWIYVLIVAFVLAAFLQPILDGAETDHSGWWLQMPYHTYTNFFFAIACAIGAANFFLWLGARFPRLRFTQGVVVLLPLWPLWLNASVCVQRGHWLGWKLGHAMLFDLPKNSVLFGGTDPGRFIPTYMIFGESRQPPRFKRDPHFDRSDLYIITQNALADEFYLRYIGDHYGPQRPPASSALERWLGRDRTYPPEPLVLPTPQEGKRICDEALEELRRSTPPPDSRKTIEGLHAAVAKWIFERNKGKHAFFLEESFPMEWTYDYATPHGFVFRLENEPVKELPAKIVQDDFLFWERTIAELKNDPAYATDFDAQRTYAKLRVTGGNLYLHRGMSAEAERACRQALELWPNEPAALASLGRMLMDRKQYDKVVELYEAALLRDPNNRGLERIVIIAELRRALDAEIHRTAQEFAKSPQSVELFKQLANLHYQCGDTNALVDLLASSTRHMLGSPDALEFAARSYFKMARFSDAERTAREWIATSPRRADPHYLLAKALHAQGKKSEAADALQKAVELGGIAMQEKAYSDPQLAPLLKDRRLFTELAPKLPVSQ